MENGTDSQAHGFTGVEVVLTVVAIIAIGAAGYFAYNGRQAKVATSPSPSASAKPSASPVDPTSGWTAYEVPAGKYSFKYNPKLFVSSGGGFTEGAAFIGTSNIQLGGSGDNLRMVLYSIAGDKRNENYGVTGQNMGDRVDKVENVTLNGVTGKRYEITATKASEMAPPVVGQKYIVYGFYKDGRTFAAFYTQAPDATDLSADFELTIRRTWKF